MRPIINLKNQDEVMGTVLNLSKQYSKELELSRGEEHYTVKFQYPEGIAIIDIDVLPSYYKFRVTEESSVLRVSKPIIPTFEVGLSLHLNEKLRYHLRPSNPEANIWLTSPLTKGQKTTRADSLIVIATACTIIWSQFLFAFNKRILNGVVEYTPMDDFKKVATDGVQAIILAKRKEHRFEGWDVVNLTQKQLLKVGEILESHQIKHDFDNIALPKFCLSLYNGKQFQYFFATYTKGNLHFDVEDDATTYVAHCDISMEKAEGDALSLELNDNTNAMEWLTHTSISDDGEEVTQWQWMVDMFFSVNSFMLHFGDVSMEVETKEAVAPSESRPQKHGNRRNSVRLFKTYKLVKNWKSKARKKAQITCPAWGVRGHYRHYKNGKVVFIESYVKGPEKAKYTGKEYALLPYRDA